MPTARMRTTSLALLAAFCLRAADPALALPAPPPPPKPPQTPDTAAIKPPPLARSVEAVISASYLSEDERKNLRIAHGVWTDADLDTPARRARACIISGRYSDPSFDDPAVALEDRAESLVMRGSLPEAVKLLEGAPGMRAARLRAQALWSLGKLDDAKASLEATRKALMDTPLADAGEVAEAVRAMVVYSRLTGDVAGPAGQDAGASRSADFKMLMSVLARAREELGRLEPSVYLAEAELLEEKENYAEASAALVQALELCPKNASAWRLLGLMSASTWDFDKALSIAARLDELAIWEANSGELFVPRSVLGAGIAARSYLPLHDAEAADAALTRGLASAPASRDLLALRAATAASTFRDAALKERLDELEAISPGAPEGPYEVGCVLSDLRQYEDSERYLVEAQRRAPHWSAVQCELGLLQVQAGRDEEALKTLTSAADLDPFNTRVANSLTLVREIASYARVSSEHFEIRYKDGIDAVMAREMLPVMEENFRRVTGNGPGGIDYVPKGRTVIELYPDHHWFSVRITGMRRVHTIAAATGPVIAMERPMTGPGHSIGPYDWPRVLRHEYTHTVTLGRTRNRLPHWFTEAGAVYLEDSPRDETRCTMLTTALMTGGLLDFTQINIAFVRPRTPNERGLAYAQGHWMYEYIVTRFGPRAPLNLMDRYARGESETDAFQSEFGLSREQFFEQFKVWARAQCQEWGTIPRDGVPTIGELLRQEASAAGADSQATAEPTPELVSRWLEKYPDHPDVLRLAVGFELAEHQGDAVESMIPMLERLAVARPIDHMPHKQLARLYLASSDPSRAIPHLEFLDQREQYSTSFAVELAKRYAAIKDWKKAGEKAERASRIAPFDPQVRELAATVAVQSKDYATARRHIEALIALEPDRDVHKKRLEALTKLQK